jgi:transposase InsO family protein
VWSYDFVSDRTHDGRVIKILTIIDEYSRQCLATVVDRHIRSDDVLYCLSDLFLMHGIPDHIRSDNGPEFTAKAVRQWLKNLGVKTIKEAQVVIEQWRQEYNTIRPHSSLNYQPPAPETMQPMEFKHPQLISEGVAFDQFLT